MNRFAVVGTLMSSVLCLGGCLITSANSEHETGAQVTTSTLDQVKVGETSEGWLIATLGEPTARQPVPGNDAMSILRYDHSVNESSGGTVLFLFAGGSSKSTTSRTYFEVTNGVVTRYWVES